MRKHRVAAVAVIAIIIICILVAAETRKLADADDGAAPRPVKAAGPSPTRTAGTHARFESIARQGGLNYRWSIPGPRPLDILQTIGNGCAFLDYDGDGNLDVLLVGPKVALYRGDGKGHFTDVSHEMGLDTLHGQFLGCAVGDYDNDGYDDVYLSGYHTGVLLHNERGKRFTDVTNSMGPGVQPWGTSCAFADLDSDGYLDLVVCNYVEFGASSRRLCDRDGIHTACSPSHYPALHAVVYHNLAGRGFEDVTSAWGLDRQRGNALGVACEDIDGSGNLSIAIANDGTGDNLFRSQGHGQFREMAAEAGTLGDAGGNRHAGMGIDWGDYDNDGQPDCFVTTFHSEAKCLYHNQGNGLFTERSSPAGIEAAMMRYVSFGCKFVDVDNDGWLDLLVASGEVEDGIDAAHRGMTYHQPLKLLTNNGDGTFANARHGSGLEILPAIVGRGLAIGDFDNDGKMDALVADSEGTPVLLHNCTPSPGHWIGFALTGTGHSNRDAYGAQVTVVTAGRRLTRTCHADGSYLSSSDRRVHVGIGSATRVDSVIIRWPDGRTEQEANCAVDRYNERIEGLPDRAQPSTPVRSEHRPPYNTFRRKEVDQHVRPL